jgi:ABC-type phosphate/phosphonate transport system substrate-binding protein
MKNKIKPIDVSILSSYMGRSLTVIVTVIVLGLTISALLRGGGSAERNIISVCVPIETSAADALRDYEPFRVLLARETRRPVVISPGQDEWIDDFDLCIMRTHDYIRWQDRAEIFPLYEISRSGRYRDKAVLISRPSEADLDYRALKSSDVAFCDPLSLNGFLIQMEAMIHRGFEPPETLAELRFEGLRGNASRVIFGVLHGAYPLGACKMSELHALSELGLLHGGELRVIHTDEALPELIIASRTKETRYYQRKLKRMAARLQADPSPVTQNETVRLLKSFGIKGLHPVTNEQLERARALINTFEKRFTQ